MRSKPERNRKHGIPTSIHSKHLSQLTLYLQIRLGLPTHHIQRHRALLRNASSIIANPFSNCSSVLVISGAILKYPAKLRLVLSSAHSPQLRHACRNHIPQLGRLSLHLAVRNDLQASHQATPTHIANARIPRLQLTQRSLEPHTEAARPLDKAVPHDNVEGLQPDSRGQRVADVRRVEEVPAVPTHGRNRIARDDRAERQAVPERLAERRHVRHDVVVRVHEGEQVARAPDPSLRFVGDQKHAADLAVRFQRFEVARR